VGIGTQRNNSFLLLVGSVAFASVLTFSPAGGQPLLIAWLAKALDINNASGLETLRASIPFTLVQGILFLLVFYFMFNLYQRSYQLIRNFQYLAALEGEIRTAMELPSTSHAFTRESTFYRQQKWPLRRLIKWTYVILLGGMLTTFVFGRLWYDYQSGYRLVTAADAVILTSTLIYYGAYVNFSLRYDR
jgi:hypothetical protein